MFWCMDKLFGIICQKQKQVFTKSIWTHTSKEWDGLIKYCTNTITTIKKIIKQ